MDDKMLRLWLLLILGIGAFGVSLLLPGRNDQPQQRIRLTGAGLIATSTLLLFVIVGRRVSWWPELYFSWWSASVLFWILAAISVASAVATIVSSTPSTSVLFFGMVLVSNSGLYVLQGAQYAAAAMLFTGAGAFAVGWLLFSRWADQRLSRKGDKLSHEPFLACVVGTLFAATLLGAIHSSLSSEAKQALDVRTNKEVGGMRSNAFPAPVDVGFSPDAVASTQNAGSLLFDQQQVGLHVVAVLMFLVIVAAVLLLRGMGGTDSMENGQKANPPRPA